MLNVLQRWFGRYLSHPEAVVLLLLLMAASSLIYCWGAIIAPFIISVIIAYLLNKVVLFIQKWCGPSDRVNYWVFLVFLICLLIGCVTVFPLLWEQAVQLVLELPNIAIKAKTLSVNYLAQHFQFISAQTLESTMANLQWEMSSVGQWLLSFSVASIPGILGIGLYLILVPILVYFMLVDKKKMTNSLTQFFPENMQYLPLLWQEIDHQMAQYILGKWWESLIFFAVSYAAFTFYQLNYALIFAVLVGFSGIIPWVGAFLVTIPLMVVAIFQWGFTSELFSFILVYAVLLILDGYVLVPLLFSEAIDIHPVYIMLAIVFFGNLMGIVGVFFSIPLAILIKILINHWPVVEKQ